MESRRRPAGVVNPLPALRAAVAAARFRIPARGRAVNAIARATLRAFRRLMVAAAPCTASFVITGRTRSRR